MKRWLYLLFFFINTHVYAELSVQLETSRVQLGDVFRLVILQTNVKPAQGPDLKPLQNDFKIMRTERSVQYSIINGQASSINQWIIGLLPKRVGKLTIPSIHIGNEQTEPLFIEVVDKIPSSINDATANANQGVMLLTDISNKSPYLNEQVIYTVQLLNNRQLLDASFEAPKVDDAFFIPLGESRRYQTSRNGQIYAVEEQQYAIFPQKSGELTIRPPTFSALMYDAVPQQIYLSGSKITLKVKPALAMQQGDWLPAKDITLEEKYDRLEPTLTQGSTLLRTITLQAVGLPAQLLPHLSFPSQEGFNVYVDKPEEENRLEQNNLVGSLSIKVTYLANKPGKIRIPGLTFTWFNTQTNKMETKNLPARELMVTAETTTASSESNDTLLLNSPLSHQTNNGEMPSKDLLTAEPKLIVPWVMAGIFALAWLFMIWAWWRRGYHPVSHKKTLHALQEACLSNQADAARKMLLQWAVCQWPDLRFANLAELSEQVNDNKLNHQINELAKVLYQQHTNVWHGDALWEAVSGFQVKKRTKKVKKKALPPINPT